MKLCLVLVLISVTLHEIFALNLVRNVKKFAAISSLSVGLLSQQLQPSFATETSKTVVVLGGNGFVGSRVVRDLAIKGRNVISVSTSGLQPALAKNEKWAENVKWVKADLRTDDLMDTFKSADSVVSCVGVIGLNNDASLEVSNGQTNKAAAEQAKKAGVSHFIYVGVSSQIQPIVGNNFMTNYFTGKTEAETAVRTNFPTGGVVLKPTFIYGGDEFSLSPPRVAAGYGSFIEGLLSSGPIRTLADAAGPGAIRLTLSPPVSVDHIAEAIAASAMDDQVPSLAYTVIEGTDDINSAATKYAVFK